MATGDAEGTAAATTGEIIVTTTKSVTRRVRYDGWRRAKRKQKNWRISRFNAPSICSK
jgi:hypothetical protein